MQDMTSMQPQGDFQQVNATTMDGSPDFGIQNQAPVFAGSSPDAVAGGQFVAGASPDPGFVGGQCLTDELKLPGEDLKQYILENREPEHSTNTWSIMIIGCIGFFLSFLSLLVCEWRSNFVGVVGYAQRRGWGLTHVVGARAQSHYQVMQFTCRAFGGLSLGGICNSPICVWYKLKCQVYIQLMWVSYTSFILILLSLLIFGICIYWTYKLTRRMIRWAATWLWCAVGLQAGAIVFYAIMTEDLFGSLHEKAIYPVPPISASFVMACISAFCMLICAVLETIEMKAWPERYEEDSDIGDSESDEFDVAEIMKDIKNAEKTGYVPAQGYPQPAYGGTHAAMQYGGFPTSQPWHATAPPPNSQFDGQNQAMEFTGQNLAAPASSPAVGFDAPTGAGMSSGVPLLRSDTRGMPTPANA